MALPWHLVRDCILPRCDVDTRRAFGAEPGRLDLGPYVVVDECLERALARTHVCPLYTERYYPVPEPTVGIKYAMPPHSKSYRVRVCHPFFHGDLHTTMYSSLDVLEEIDVPLQPGHWYIDTQVIRGKERCQTCLWRPDLRSVCTRESFEIRPERTTPPM